jgi:hypothetical protein
MKTPYRLPSEIPSDAPPSMERDDDLGAFVSVHVPRTSLLPVVAMFFFLTIAAVSGWVQQRGIAYLSIGGFGIACLMTMISALFARLRPQFELWDRGIRVKRRWTMTRRVRFDEIDSVTYEPDVSRLPLLDYLCVRIEMVTFDDRRIVLPRNLSDTEQILAALDRHVTRPLLAPAKRAFSAGETLRFGSVVLEKEQVLVDDMIVPIDDLDCVEATTDHVRFYGKNTDWPPFASVRIETVVHPRVLLAVLATRVPVENASGI